MTISYVITDRTKKRDWFALQVTGRNEAVEPNPANSTRLRVLFNHLYNYNNEIAIKYSLREHSH